jgi:hypothetical protein
VAVGAAVTFDVIRTSSANLSFNAAQTGVVVAQAGVYQVTFGVIASTASNDNWDLTINGAAAALAGNNIGFNATTSNQSLTLIVQLAANSTLAIVNNTAGSRTLTTTTGANGSPSSVNAYMTIVQLR